MFFHFMIVEVHLNFSKLEIHYTFFIFYIVLTCYVYYHCIRSGFNMLFSCFFAGFLLFSPKVSVYGMWLLEVMVYRNSYLNRMLFTEVKQLEIIILIHFYKRRVRPITTLQNTGLWLVARGVCRGEILKVNKQHPNFQEWLFSEIITSVKCQQKL